MIYNHTGILIVCMMIILSIEYFRLKMNGDIQIWKTYETKSEIWGLYEVIDTKNGNRDCILASLMPCLWDYYIIYREGVINAT
ncbi:MAG: hypothetical protein CM15mV81_330 [uncultured marine virus]|nr:MAG: hypothetical protein CM15mV81_330 [uncultured marine virus]